MSTVLSPFFLLLTIYIKYDIIPKNSTIDNTKQEKDMTFFKTILMSMLLFTLILGCETNAKLGDLDFQLKTDGNNSLIEYSADSLWFPAETFRDTCSIYNPHPPLKFLRIYKYYVDPNEGNWQYVRHQILNNDYSATRLADVRYQAGLDGGFYRIESILRSDSSVVSRRNLHLIRR